MTVSANLPLASYAAGLDDMIAKTVELRHECDPPGTSTIAARYRVATPPHPYPAQRTPQTRTEQHPGGGDPRQRREDPAALEWRVRASVDAMQACHFTTTELQILLALALDRLA